jgi:DNA-binding transcriptional MerR regulator
MQNTLTKGESERFSQRDLNLIFRHISPRTLLSWATGGLLGCFAEGLDGRGKVRQYAIENIYEVVLIEELSSLNVPLEIIGYVMDLLKEKFGPLANNRDKFIFLGKGKGGFGGWKAPNWVIVKVLNEKELQKEFHEQVKEIKIIPSSIILNINDIYYRAHYYITNAGFDSGYFNK